MAHHVRSWWQQRAASLFNTSARLRRHADHLRDVDGACEELAEAAAIIDRWANWCHGKAGEMRKGQKRELA